MKTETESRNSKDTTEDKIMAVLEHFFWGEHVTEIYSAIHDNQCDVKDIETLISIYE
jgi:hypothetical protein